MCCSGCETKPVRDSLMVHEYHFAVTVSHSCNWSACDAACCSVLQRVAVCCSVLQRVAVCCTADLFEKDIHIDIYIYINTYICVYVCIHIHKIHKIHIHILKKPADWNCPVRKEYGQKHKQIRIYAYVCRYVYTYIRIYKPTYHISKGPAAPFENNLEKIRAYFDIVLTGLTR